MTEIAHFRTISNIGSTKSIKKLVTPNKYSSTGAHKIMDNFNRTSKPETTVEHAGFSAFDLFMQDRNERVSRVSGPAAIDCALPAKDSTPANGDSAPGTSKCETPESQTLLRLIDNAKTNGELAPNLFDELKVVSNECAINPELYATMQNELRNRGVRFSIDNDCATFERFEFHGFYSNEASLKVPLDGSAATGFGSVLTGSSMEGKTQEIDKDIAAKFIFAPEKRTSIFID